MYELLWRMPGVASVAGVAGVVGVAGDLSQTLCLIIQDTGWEGYPLLRLHSLVFEYSIYLNTEAVIV
jgi:hypothetical protein